MEQAAREDAELIRRTLAGDRNAFEGLVLRYHRDLMRLLRRITRSIEDAEDLTQETFLRTYRALDRFDLEKPFRPWLWTIGIRLALHAIAKKGRSNVSLDGADDAPEGEGRRDGPWLADTRSLERIDENLMQRDLMEALDQMDPQHRAILILRVIEERSYEEIATILQIPQGTVMSRLNRARISLRKKLSGWFPAGEEDGRSM
jgi:RNA polymerase sigma-70 factor, ECF subfamily